MESFQTGWEKINELSYWKVWKTGVKKDCFHLSSISFPAESIFTSHILLCKQSWSFWSQISLCYALDAYATFQN